MILGKITMKYDKLRDIVRYSTYLKKSIMKELSLLFYSFYTILCAILFFTVSGEYNSIYIYLPLILYFIFLFFKFSINKKTDWFSMESLFVGFFYLIHFGYLACYELDLVDYDFEVFWSSLHMNSTIFLATGAISSYLLGFSIISTKTEYRKLEFFHKDENSIWMLSKILLILVLMMFWLPLLSILSLALSDYNNLIRVGELSIIGRLYWIGQYLAIFPLIMVFYGSFKYNKLNNLFFYLAFFYIFCYLAIGDRGGFLYFVVIPLIAYHYLYKKIEIKKISVYVLIILFVSSVISVSRVSSTYNPIEAYKLYEAAEHKDNPLVDAITEFGTSVKTVNIILANIPDNYDYWYGKSYFDAFLITFPNFFGNRVSQGIDVWLTETFFGKNTYGRGGSILMESYGNFGFLGTILFFNMLGLFSGGLYRKIKSSGNLVYFIIYLAFAASICIWMRNTSSYFFRTLAWTVFLYYIILFLIPYLPKKFKVKK